MASPFNKFVDACVTASNLVFGTESVTLSNGIVLDGVWSSVTGNAESAGGGEQFMATTSVCVPASSSVTKSLIGKTCTYNGTKLKVSNVEIGTSESTVYFNDETEGLKL